LVCAVSTSTENKEGFAAITSKACVPIEPVEPNMATLFTGKLFTMNYKEKKLTGLK
jgi:hypothetical protein